MAYQAPRFALTWRWDDKKGLIGIMILGALFIVISRLLGLSERRIETAMSYVTYPLLQFPTCVVRSFLHI